ncbi:thermonuclease family protein [Catenovulum sp. SM1970]|uniref:thermonuclease family protein n=1 Tax=Marinifaba aquimaris TaxID=2741323 RepID=UPI0015723922|nr:thermonuclease family protein [Marinifaba aquimaris]NTS76550.1 thermonuclease family protein [Marinifaba aquimaris]
MFKSLLSFFLLLMLPCYALANAKCSAASFDQTETITKVIDGDTVRLRDGSLVRLIGIDAPEMDFDDATKSEADALKAKEYLAQLIGKKKVHLSFDQDFIDPYNRMLAHLYNDQGQNLQAAMLSAGLAKHWVIGANDQFWPCYKKAEIKARQAKQNIWFPTRSNVLSSEEARYYRGQYKEYQGKITRVWSDDDNVTWVVLDKYLYLGIRFKDLALFEKYQLSKERQGELFVVRGKTYYHKKRWRIDLTHPWQVITQSELTR